MLKYLPQTRKKGSGVNSAPPSGQCRIFQADGMHACIMEKLQDLRHYLMRAKWYAQLHCMHAACDRCAVLCPRMRPRTRGLSGSVSCKINTSMVFVLGHRLFLICVSYNAGKLSNRIRKERTKSTFSNLVFDIAINH